MKTLALVLLCAGVLFAQGSGTGGPGGFPAWLGYGTDPDEQSVYVNGDTLFMDSLKLMDTAATSYLSMSGDTLFFTLTGVSGDRDIVHCYVEEDGTKHCFKWDDGDSRFDLVGNVQTGPLVVNGSTINVAGRVFLNYVGLSGYLQTSSALPTLVVDPYLAGSGTLQLGETGDADITWLNSLGRLEGSIADSTYTTGATEEIWIEQSAADTVYLPASPTAGDWFKVKFTNASGGVLSGNGNTIDGAAVQAASENDAFDLIFNGTEWGIF